MKSYSISAKVEDKEIESTPKNDDKSEEEINLEAELTSALDDHDDEKRKNKKLSKLRNANNEEVNILIEKFEESRKVVNELDEQLSLKVIENSKAELQYMPMFLFDYAFLLKSDGT
ncbi:hypothetical protein NE237_001280 [Protea cynaroides]|uniref:Uncharacterized protein n=1 Tax=Protea cynaroides TaxID=273540 RepID=A0A9Q0KT76_9MAGN|nr:hypothetical protein NE237_001280 [Protea cynaroides]